mmetsp:Transcript_11007/g.18026  ORF Transcript_11007/g.18026 Transcript_11007/m.18026 type:complete len:88 (-) Transcript_11007:476-739(-)
MEATGTRACELQARLSISETWEACIGTDLGRKRHRGWRFPRNFGKVGASRADSDRRKLNNFAKETGLGNHRIWRLVAKLRLATLCKS